MAAFDPYSVEGHYGLDLACRLLHARRPSAVAIYSDDLNVTLAAVRRLGWVPGDIFVESTQIADALRASLGVEARVITSGIHADVALVPFAWSRLTSPPDAACVVLLSHNAWSYKSLIAPGTVGATGRSARRWLEQTHAVRDAVGLFTPSFIAQWTVSLASGTRWPNWHFRLGQRAMDRLYSGGVLHRLGYLLVLSGDRRETE